MYCFYELINILSGKIYRGFILQDKKHNILNRRKYRHLKELYEDLNKTYNFKIIIYKENISKEDFKIIKKEFISTEFKNQKLSYNKRVNHSKNKVPVIDEKGNKFLIDKYDPKYLKKEVIPISKGNHYKKTNNDKKTFIKKDGNIISISLNEYKKGNYEHINTNKVLIDNKYYDIRDSRFLSKELISPYNIKFKDFDKLLFVKNKKYYSPNFCEHGDLIIDKRKFEYIYNNEDDIKIYCNECRNNYIKSTRNKLDFNKSKKIINSLHISQLNENYIYYVYPSIYKIIIETYNLNISWKEKIFLLKNGMYEIPECSQKNCKSKVLFNKNHSSFSKLCEKHKYNFYNSSYENELYDFVKKYYKQKIIQNDRDVISKELDIYIPELKIAFEFNGLYWHSDIFKDKKYHYNKWKECNDKGIKLITIWEDDWNHKQDIIKSIILNSLNKTPNKIYARQSQIKDINYKETKTFLNDNHLQGWCQSSINLGLYYNNELVSLMTFGKRKISGKKQYELLRFCNKLNTNVIGGASKLFKYFLNNYNENIVSYANCDISNGNLYKVLGFKEEGHTGINYWWVKDRRYHRSKFMKHKLIKEGYDSNKTESEIMREREYYKIYGTGNLLFTYQM